MEGPSTQRCGEIMIGTREQQHPAYHCHINGALCVIGKAAFAQSAAITRPAASHIGISATLTCEGYYEVQP